MDCGAVEAAEDQCERVLRGESARHKHGVA